MDDKEIGEKIGELTDKQRNELYRLCEMRKRQPGPDVAVYVKVSEAIGKTLHDKHLVWLMSATLAAARGDVYLYWKKHIDSYPARILSSEENEVSDGIGIEASEAGLVARTVAPVRADRPVAHKMRQKEETGQQKRDQRLSWKVKLIVVHAMAGDP